MIRRFVERLVNVFRKNPPEESSPHFLTAFNCLHSCHDDLFIKHVYARNMKVVASYDWEGSSNPDDHLRDWARQEDLSLVCTSRMRVKSESLDKLPEAVKLLFSWYLEHGDKNQATKISFPGMNFGETKEGVDFFLFGYMSKPPYLKENEEERQ